MSRVLRAFLSVPASPTCHIPQFQSRFLFPLWEAVKGQPLLEDPFLDELRVFARQANAAMVDALKQSPTLFSAFRRRLERALPAGEGSPPTFMQHELEELMARPALGCSAQEIADSVEAARDNGPAAKRLKQSDGAEKGGGFVAVLDAFESGLAQWRQRVQAGESVPSWFDSAVRALGQELA